MTGRNGAARPLIVELVGPAGVGKSALAQRLLAQPDVVRASVWNLPAALLIESAVRSLPLLFRLCVVTRALPREELKQIVRLNALRLFVGRRVGRARRRCERVRAGRARAGGPPPLTLATTGTTPVRLGDAVLALLAERSHG